MIPLFPEIKQELKAAWDPEQVYIINKYRDPSQNMRTQLLRIIDRAGLKPWPKLFHNLRATRQTELAQTFPAHVVSDWLGNSVTVANEHYLRTMDIDFERAIAPAEKASQKASHSGAGTCLAGGNMSNAKNASPAKGKAFLEVTLPCTSVQDNSMTLGRFEPPF